MGNVSWKRFRWIVILSLCLAPVAAAGEEVASAPASQPAKVKITISRETTYILGPVNADGTINYVAALNAMYSKGVTPENNAAIPLIQALGPEMIDKLVRERTFKILRMTSLPKKGEYFQNLEDYEKAHDPKWQAESALEDVDDHLKKAMEAPWSAKDHPITAGWLRANEKPLALVVTATKRHRCYFPFLSWSKPPRMIEVSFPGPFGRFRWSIARALVARAMLHAGSGDMEAAQADLMTMHRLARLIGQGSTLVDRLVAIATEALACDAAARLATSGKLTAAQAKAHLADLQALPPLPGVVEVIDREERFSTLDCVAICAREGLRKAWPLITRTTLEEGTPDLVLDWNVPLRRANQWYDKMIAACRKETFAERRQAMGTVTDDLIRMKVDATRSKLRMRLFTSQYVGDLLLSLFIPTLGGATEFHDQAVMRRRVAEVALALAAYKAKRGKYSAKLADLAPEYLKNIPNDLFIEKPLHYRRMEKGYLLYSVGPNMKDDGGKGRDDGEDFDDITVRAK